MDDRALCRKSRAIDGMDMQIVTWCSEYQIDLIWLCISMHYVVLVAAASWRIPSCKAAQIGAPHAISHYRHYILLPPTSLILRTLLQNVLSPGFTQSSHLAFKSTEGSLQFHWPGAFKNPGHLACKDRANVGLASYWGLTCQINWMVNWSVPPSIEPRFRRWRT